MLRRTALCNNAAPSKASYNVVISGGGIVGAAALRGMQILNDVVNVRGIEGAAPQEDSVGMNVALADMMPAPSYTEGALRHQIRTVAVTPMSSRILDGLGAWQMLENRHPYYRMAIRHETASATADSSTAGYFFNALKGKSRAPLIEFTDLQQPLGYICLNDELQHQLFADAAKYGKNESGEVLSAAHGNTTVMNGVAIHGVQPPPKGSPALIEGYFQKAKLPPHLAKLQPAAAQEEGEAPKNPFEAGLVIGCDGGASPLRGATGSPSVTHDFAQHGFVCSVEIENIDDGNMCCFQNFFEDGSIIGYLPTGPKTANLVFSCASGYAMQLNKMSTPELVEIFNKRLHQFAPDDIPKIVDIVADSKSRAMGAFPLRLIVATNPVANRLMLIGDAAHAVHPMAGQGLNLGLYDVAALVDTLRDAHRNGEDIGSLTVGNRFAAQMFHQTAPVLAAIETIKSSVTVMPQLSCLGMSAINQIGPVKNQIMHHAAGGHLIPKKPGDSILFTAE